MSDNNANVIIFLLCYYVFIFFFRIFSFYYFLQLFSFCFLYEVINAIICTFFVFVEFFSYLSNFSFSLSFSLSLQIHCLRCCIPFEFFYFFIFIVLCLFTNKLAKMTEYFSLVSVYFSRINREAYVKQRRRFFKGLVKVSI